MNDDNPPKTDSKDPKKWYLKNAAIPLLVACIGFFGLILAAILGPFITEVVRHFLNPNPIGNFPTQTIAQSNNNQLPQTPTSTPDVSPTITYSLTPSITASLTPSSTPTPSLTPTPTETITPVPISLPITEDFTSGISNLWTKKGNFVIEEGWLKGVGDPFNGDVFIMTLDGTLSDYSIGFDCKGCGISYNDDVVFLIAETIEYNVGRVHTIKDIVNKTVLLDTGYVKVEGYFEIRIKGNSINSFINGAPVVKNFIYGDKFSGPLTVILNTHGVKIDNLTISPAK